MQRKRQKRKVTQNRMSLGAQGGEESRARLWGQNCINERRDDTKGKISQVTYKRTICGKVQ